MTRLREYREVTATIPEVVGQTGLSYPFAGQHEDITLLMVAWNESARIGPLIEYLKEWFTHFVVCVQESDDDTLAIARAHLPAYQVLEDRHWGYGDRSFDMMRRQAKTPWCFVVSCDEWPDQTLLESLHLAVAYAQLERMTNEAVWVRIEETLEGMVTPDEVHHLRVFRSYLEWPKTLHSRPMTGKGIGWPHGYIAHERSLDEMMQDYLSYYAVGRGNAGWDRHNLMMMHEACLFVANAKGWAYVEQYPWWPQVAAIAFSKEELRG